jgi:hypothetical protein
VAAGERENEIFDRKKGALVGRPMLAWKVVG